ncbi:hypothetical protein [Escherichia phage UPEC01]|nr:hypothetical protein [Escherichia phage UPEC01]
MNIYLIKYLKDGKERDYQIPAKNEYDACVRLGQIHGDDREYRNDVEIEIQSVTLKVRG